MTGKLALQKKARTMHLEVFYQMVGFISTCGPLMARVEANSKTGRFHPQRSEVEGRGLSEFPKESSEEDVNF